MLDIFSGVQGARAELKFSGTISVGVIFMSKSVFQFEGNRKIAKESNIPLSISVVKVS